MTFNDDLLWLIKPASVTGNINFNYSASAVLITHTGPFYRVIKITQDSMSMHASGKCMRGEGGREIGFVIRMLCHLWVREKRCKREEEGAVL